MDTEFQLWSNLEKEVEKYDLHEWKYQRHKIIQTNRNPSGASTFCLTLFGVLVALLLLGTGKKLPMGLFYKGYKYCKYFDTIAKNYATKLPLIFGNWDYLKSVLGYICIC